MRGQCEAMRHKIDEGLTARGVRAVRRHAAPRAQKHGEVKAERGQARDALKLAHHAMLAELDELGSRRGNFHESVGRYAAVIEDRIRSKPDRRVREMVAEAGRADAGAADAGAPAESTARRPVSPSA